MAQELVKAIVRVLDGTGPDREIEVIFNPTEYNVDYGANFQETAPPGLNNPILQFVNGTAQSLTMDLLFDTYTDGRGANVAERTKKFTDMVAINGELHAPPRVEFEWGVFSFKAIVEKISQRFTMFLSDGTPVRATLSVTFKQYQTVAEQLENPRRNSNTKRRVFEAHDSLWLLAAREYGEPKYWRLIARRNRIEDPRALVPGMVVILPPLEDFKMPEAGNGS